MTPKDRIDQIISLTQDLVRIESLSGQEGAAGEVVQERMFALGYDEVDVDRFGNVIGSIRGTRRSDSGKSVLFDGHLDTVAPAQLEKWSVDPFSGMRRDKRIYGLGAADMKGSLASMIVGLSDLPRENLWGTVFVSASIGEEILEGVALSSVLEKTNPDYVVIGEPTDFRIGTAQKGRAGLVIDTKGVAAHSAQPHQGVNAVYKMMEVIQRLRDLKLPSDPVLGDGIMELIDIKSTPFPSRSVVPTGCTARYDRRLVLGETPETVLRGIKDFLGTTTDVDVRFNQESLECYTGETLEDIDFHPAWKIGETSEFVSTAQRALEPFGVETEPIRIHYCSNGSYSAGVASIPTIIFGPPSIEQAHAIDEYIEIEDLGRAAAYFLALAIGLIGSDHG
jgi:putative selenium metabolism hydrolase